MKTSNFKRIILFIILILGVKTAVAQTITPTPPASAVTIFSTPEKEPPDSYENYLATESGVEMAYPPDLLTHDPEYEVFYSKDLQTYITLWNLYNRNGDLKKDFEDVQKWLSDVQITYKVIKSNFFVISGYQGNNVIYWKVIHANVGHDLVFEMAFPKDQKQVWDPVLTTCAHSINPFRVENTRAEEEADEEFEQFEEDKADAREQYENEETGNEPTKTTPSPITHIPIMVFTPEPRLDSPTHFNVEPGNGLIHMTWDRMPGTNGYKITILKDSRYMVSPLIRLTQANELTVAGLSNGTQYFVSVNCYGKGRDSKNEALYTYLPNNVIPIDYTPTYPEFKNKYLDPEIYITTGSVFRTPVPSITPLPAPDPPTHLKIEPGNCLAWLTWDAMPNALGYVLYQSEDGKKFQRRIYKTFQHHEVVISVLTNGKSYYFGVACVGSDGVESKMAVQMVEPRKDAVIERRAFTTPFE
jgi:hypothetical protein